VDAIASMAPGHAVQLAREAYDQGYRRFLARRRPTAPPTKSSTAFSRRERGKTKSRRTWLPSHGERAIRFLRRFHRQGRRNLPSKLSSPAASGRVDVSSAFCHASGTIYSFNLLSGWLQPRTSGALANRRFKAFGHFGLSSWRLRARPAAQASRPSSCAPTPKPRGTSAAALFLTFNNSKYTGGTMMIAPNRRPFRRLYRICSLGPHRPAFGLLKMLPRLYDGTHTPSNPLSENPPRQASGIFRSTLPWM